MRRKGLFRSPHPRRAASVAILIAAAPTFLVAQTENILYRFQAGSDGSCPSSALVADQAGNLYGTTVYGGGTNCNFYGTLGCGTVFELSPPATPGGAWTETVLYRFQGGNSDGAFPGQIVFDHDGNLYGVTGAGGAGPDCIVNTTGCGTVFKLAPSAAPSGPWAETVLYSFQSGNDGAIPAAITIGRGGHLYGVTTQAGSAGSGTVFKLTPPGSSGVWTKTVLHNFKGISQGQTIGDGATPISLTFDGKGNLYGTTEWGGIYTGSPESGSSWGTVFELTPPSQPARKWNYIVLHRFAGYLQNPVSGVVVNKSGAVYGTTYAGVYELIPGTALPIHMFSTSNDGKAPYGGVILDAAGNLYGVCLGGGQMAHGIVYRLQPPPRTGPPWAETILYQFSGSPDGDAPDAPLYLHNGILYGTTLRGGNQGCQLSGGEIGCGTVFSLVP